MSSWSCDLHVCPCHIEHLKIGLHFLKWHYICLRLCYFIKASIRVMWPNIGHAVWNVPICLCVCACYLRQLLTQLRAGGPWHQCGWREARYWRRVQRVLNPGLLEGSPSFSHSALSLHFLLSPSVCKASCETMLQLDQLYEVYCVWSLVNDTSGPWDAACLKCIYV